MSPPIKDPIPNQYINILITEKDPSLPPHLEKYPPGYKSLWNGAHNPNIIEYDRNDSTDNSHNKKEYSVNNLKVTNNEDNYEKYNDDNSQVLNSNESVINRTKMFWEKWYLIYCNSNVLWN